MYKKLTAAITAAFTFFSLTAVCLASADIPVTGDDIKEMAWSHTLDKEKNLDEILALEYQDDSDLNSQSIKLSELIDPSKSIYEGINKTDDREQSLWLCADKNGSGVYYSLILDKDKNGKMKITDINDFSDFVPYWFDNDEWFAKAADAVNANLSGTVNDVYMDMLHLKFLTDSGAYILFRNENTSSAAPADGFINIDDHTLLAEENAYNSYLEENDALTDKWFEEANLKMREMFPELRYETKESRGVYDKETVTDSLAEYNGKKSIYSDVPDEYAPYVNCLADIGIMNGTADNEFSPDRIVTRAEMAAVMSRAFMLESGAEGLFGDVPDEYWAAPYINALAKTGVFESSDGFFRPNDPVTYDELFKTVVLMMGYGMDYYAMPTDKNYPYGTNNTAISFGFADGLDSFKTTDGVTRLNLAVILCNMLDTQLYTTELTVGLGNPGFIISQHRDITLAEYLNGIPIEHGFLVRGLNEYEDFDKYMADMRKQASPVISELNQKLSQRYFLSGWIRTGYGGDDYEGTSVGVKTAGSGYFAADEDYPENDTEKDLNQDGEGKSDNPGGASHSSGVIKTE